MSPMIQKAIDELSHLSDQQIMILLEIIAKMKSESTIPSQDNTEQLFYSDKNMEHLLKNVQEENEGKLTEHNLIEVE